MTPDAEVDGWYDALERERDSSHVRAYTLREWRTFISEAGLEWVVGDCDTRYDIDIDSWVARVNPEPAAREAVARLFESADEHSREVFQIHYDGVRAVRFEMPMALILAVKPGA